MGSTERREREKEQARVRIVEAARDLLLEQGLAGLSMRSIADRVDYSPATIYLYFRDKDELIREVVQSGFETLRTTADLEVGRLPETASGAEKYGAMGRAYARFAIESTAYFRVMFELPGSAAMGECPEPSSESDHGFADTIALVAEGMADGSIPQGDPHRVALIGWGLIHGMTTLYLTGHLSPAVSDNEMFMRLIDDAIEALGAGWAGQAAAGHAADAGD